MFIADAAAAQCTGGGTPTASIQLLSPAFAQFATQLQLTEYYPSNVDFGTATSSLSSGQIAITQANLISNSPSLTCRTQVLDLGVLPPGAYDVTWTTTENFISFPTPHARVLTLSFVIQPAAAIPAADPTVLFFMVLTLGGAGWWRLRH